MNTEGILDLLAAILILGIVLAIAFGFVVPLTRSDAMYYNGEYQDKSALGVDRQGLQSGLYLYDDAFENSNAQSEYHRMYTYEELMLLLFVQDEMLPTPKTLNIRNLTDVATINLQTNAKAANETNRNVDLWNSWQNASIRSAVLTGNHSVFNFIEFTEGVKVEDNQEETVYKEDLNKPSVGNILFESDYSLTVDKQLARYGICYLGTLQRTGFSSDYFKRLVQFTNDPAYDLDNASYVPDNKDRYFISFRYKVPKRAPNVGDTYYRNYLAEDGWFVEVKYKGTDLFPSHDYSGVYVNKYGNGSVNSINPYLDTYRTYKEAMEELKNR